MSKFNGISTQELEAEIKRRRDNPTPLEKKAREREEKQRQTQMLLDRLYREEPKDACEMWEIKGEDENPDMGGSHHQNRLAVVKGTYRKACEYAITLKGFVSWGYGGNVVAIKPHEYIEL